jgi:hypothetical protein
MLGMETWLGLEDALKAAKQQAGTDEQDHGEYHFDNDQSSAQAISLRALRSAAATFFERVHDVDARGTECRNDTEEQADDDRESQRKTKHGGIQSYAMNEWNVWWHQSQKRAGTQGEANGHLLLAVGGASRSTLRDGNELHGRDPHRRFETKKDSAGSF